MSFTFPVTFAGNTITTEFSGISFVTIAPKPINAFSPILTLGEIMDFIPSFAFSPISWPWMNSFALFEERYFYIC